MPKVSPIQSNFNAGELSPRLAGRTDFDKYKAGCYRCENFIPLVQGPAERRPGTHYVAETKNSSSSSWLVPFNFNVQQSYQIELGEKYARFYTNRGQVISGGVPYEIAAPFASADLGGANGTFAPSFVQSNDVVYWACAGYYPQMLQRFGNTNWSFAQFGLPGPPASFIPYQYAFQGPFQSFNADNGQKINASATTGAINLSATAGAPFKPWMVGLLILIESDHGSAVTAWEPAKARVAGDVRRTDNRVYVAQNNATTGTIRPTHTEGTQFDGDAGVSWLYLHSGFGVAQITSVIDGGHATATVLMTMPSDIVGIANATARFAVSAWNSNDGYPTCVRFFRERLGFFRGAQFWLSAPADFINFAEFDLNGEVTPDCAISGTLSSSTDDAIIGAEETSQGLLVRTTGGEYLMSEINPSDPLSADNIRAQKQSSHGSHPVTAIPVEESVLYVQRGGRKVREATFSIQSETIQSRNLTVIAEHVTKPSIAQMCFQQDPASIMWAKRSDGLLLSFTYDREQDVYGWHRHPMGTAIIESISVIPAPDGSQDDLWMIVNRTIQGHTRRYVEYLQPSFGDGDDIRTAWYVDSAQSYAGSPITFVSGAGHLEGEAVDCLVDGSPVKAVVSSGVVTPFSDPDRTFTSIILGLPYLSVLATMRRDEGAADGTGQGKIQRIHKLVLRLLNTVGGKYGPSMDQLDDIVMRDSSDPMSGPIPAFTGDIELPYQGDYERGAVIYHVQDQPLPMTVVATMPQLETQDG